MSMIDRMNELERRCALLFDQWEEMDWAGLEDRVAALEQEVGTADAEEEEPDPLVVEQLEAVAKILDAAPGESLETAACRVVKERDMYKEALIHSRPKIDGAP